MKEQEVKNLKKGDLILVIKSNNGQKNLNGQIVEFVSISGHVVNVLHEENKANIFTSGPPDEFILANKEGVITYYTEKRDSLLSEIKEIEAKIEHHTKYDSKEDYLAEKIEELLSADGAKAKAEVLKLMRAEGIF